MPDIQGGYAATMDPARLGQIANTTDFDISTGVSETADVPFGVAMIAGAAADSAAIGAAGYFIGLTIRQPALPEKNGDKYQLGDNVALMTRGTMWVISTGAACVRGDPVYRTAAGALTKTSAGNTLIPGCFFDMAAASGALARIVLH